MCFKSEQVINKVIYVRGEGERGIKSGRRVNIN